MLFLHRMAEGVEKLFFEMRLVSITGKQGKVNPKSLVSKKCLIPYEVVAEECFATDPK